MREKRQRNPSFNDWYAFELLPLHLEYEALQTYKKWTNAHWRELHQVEWYSETHVELDSALKEGVTFNLLFIHEAKSKTSEVRMWWMCKDLRLVNPKRRIVHLWR